MPQKRSDAVRRIIALLTFAPLCLALIFSSGCAATRLKADYTDYEAAYAQTSNQEMLLNLARLDQHDPTFFFKLGQIGTQYQMGASLTGNGMFSPTSNANGVGGGGAPTVSYQKTPTFQFIPVNDDTTAQLLLKPIDPEIFYALYQQGWRVDQLFRLMVDRIEFREPNGKYWEVIRNAPTLDNVENYARFLRVSAVAYEMQKLGYLRLEGRQQPTRIVSTSESWNPPSAKDMLDAQSQGLNWKQDATTGEWELEKKGKLIPVFILNVPTTPAELQNAADDADASALAAEATANSNPGDPAAAAAKIAAESVKAAADKAAADADAAATDAKTAAANPADATAAATAKTSAATAAASAQNSMIVRIDADMPELAVGGRGGENVQQVFLAILESGFTVEGNVNSADSPDDSSDSTDETTSSSAGGSSHSTKNSATPGKSSTASAQGSTNSTKDSAASASNSADSGDDSGNVSCHLVMRSLIGVMSAAAEEQDEFDQLKNYPYIPTPTAAGTTEMRPFSDVVPRIEQQPIITLTWKPEDSVIAPLVQLTYRNQQYLVTDVKAAGKGAPNAPANGQRAPALPDDNAAWNRDSFRLISQLAAQVTVDISKFPVPTILQLTAQ